MLDKLASPPTFRMDQGENKLIQYPRSQRNPAQTGAVTLIQHFGSALNLNIHFHMIFLDGVYTGGSNSLPIWFRPVTAPNRAELTRLTHTIAHRVGRYLARVTPVRRGKRKTSYLADEADQTPVEKRASMTWSNRLKRVFNIEIETSNTNTIFQGLFRTWAKGPACGEDYFI